MIREGGGGGKLEVARGKTGEEEEEGFRERSGVKEGEDKKEGEVGGGREEGVGGRERMGEGGVLTSTCIIIHL